MNGVVNKDLLPIVPIKAKRKDSEWQDLNLLLDTGFNGEIMLDPVLLDEHNLIVHQSNSARLLRLYIILVARWTSERMNDL